MIGRDLKQPTQDNLEIPKDRLEESSNHPHPNERRVVKFLADAEKKYGFFIPFSKEQEVNGFQDIMDYINSSEVDLEFAYDWR